MKKLQINHFAVWLSALVAQFVPPIWYDLAFYGVRWMELNEFVEADFDDYNMPLGLTLAFLSTLATAYLMAFLFTKLNVDSGLKGLKFALIFWAGFLFLEVTTQNMFSLRPFELTLIDELVVLIKYEIIGITLGIWSKTIQPQNK